MPKTLARSLHSLGEYIKNVQSKKSAKQNVRSNRLIVSAWLDKSVKNDGI